MELAIQKFIIFAIIIFCILILWYTLSPKRRLIKSLNNFELISKYVMIKYDLYSEKNRELKLCDFYICSAYRPYVVKNQYIDYIDLEIVKKLLKEITINPDTDTNTYLNSIGSVDLKEKTSIYSANSSFTSSGNISSIIRLRYPSLSFLYSAGSA